MRKLLALTLLSIAPFNVSFASESMVGKWGCNMVSEYGEFPFTLTLNKDYSFKNEKDMFGKLHIGTGKWTVSESTLIMTREKYIKDGTAKDSIQEFKRKIVSNDGSTLKMEHDKIITTCTK